jgi:hypothetical protein
VDPNVVGCTALMTIDNPNPSILYGTVAFSRRLVYLASTGLGRYEKQVVDSPLDSGCAAKLR